MLPSDYDRRLEKSRGAEPHPVGEMSFSGWKPTDGGFMVWGRINLTIFMREPEPNQTPAGKVPDSPFLAREVTRKLGVIEKCQGKTNDRLLQHAFFKPD